MRGYVRKKIYDCRIEEIKIPKLFDDKWRRFSRYRDYRINALSTSLPIRSEALTIIIFMLFSCC